MQQQHLPKMGLICRRTYTYDLESRMLIDGCSHARGKFAWHPEEDCCNMQLCLGEAQRLEIWPQHGSAPEKKTDLPDAIASSSGSVELPKTRLAML